MGLATSRSGWPMRRLARWTSRSRRIASAACALLLWHGCSSKDASRSGAASADDAPYTPRQPQPAKERAALRARLEDARALWESMSIDTYAFVQQSVCFCPGLWDPRRVAVEEGESVESSTLFVTEQTVENMSDIFDYAQAAVESDSERVDIEFSDEYGYPQTVDVDARFNTSDDESTLWLRCVEVEPPDLSEACTLFDVTCYSPAQNSRPAPAPNGEGCPCEVDGQEFCVFGWSGAMVCKDGFWKVELDVLCQSDSCDAEPSTLSACLASYNRCTELSETDFCGNDPRQ